MFFLWSQALYLAAVLAAALLAGAGTQPFSPRRGPVGAARAATPALSTRTRVVKHVKRHVERKKVPFASGPTDLVTSADPLALTPDRSCPLHPRRRNSRSPQTEPSNAIGSSPGTLTKLHFERRALGEIRLTFI